MGNAEKDPQNQPDPKKATPKLDAILPDDIPPAAAELIGDIDSYQKRMEKEWESAKTSYEQKINHIMEEFMVAGAAAEGEDKEPRKPSMGSFPGPLPETPRKKTGTPDDRLKELMGQLEMEFRRASSTKKRIPFFSQAQPESLQLGWSGSKPLNRKKILIGASVAVALLGVFIFGCSMMVRVSPIPYAHTLGPVVAKNNVYIMDWFRRSLYTHEDSSALTIRSIEPLANSMAVGFAMSEKTIWTLDGFEHKIYLHAVTPDHQVLSSVSTPGKKPVGLFYDGTDLWSADEDEKMLYRHRGNDLEDIRDTFPLPQINVTAFAFHKNRLWILDGKSRLVGVYRLQKPMLQLGLFDLDPFVKGATPTGFAIEGSKMLVVTENPALLIRIPLSRLQKSKTEVL